MTIDQGMNIAEVKALGEQLKATAGKLDHVVQLLNTSVGSTTWVGPDASKFKNEWWPGHRSRIQQIRADIDGFGQSAMNNASEQDRASGEGGASSVTVAATAGAVAATVGAAAVGAQGVVSPAGRDWQEVKQQYDQWATGGFANPNDAQYQCTAWANFRWHELGYAGVVPGNGGAMAGNAPGDPSGQPSLHAMASYGAGTATNPGHVMIVEELSADGNRIRVSEMNVSPDGDWLNASADEFRDGRWITRAPDGTFHGSGNQAISFAAFPGS